jgi:hypothetical protein
MNTIRVVLDSGWTVAGVTIAWLLFIAGLLARVSMRSPVPAHGHTRLWPDRDGRGDAGE